jgi:membrane associated rhomboid family serine protease
MAIANGYFRVPPVVKNLLIINIVIFLAQMLLPDNIGRTIEGYGALWFVSDSAGGGIMFQLSHAWQLVTYMFLHADAMHIFSNMFTLWMFGRILEQDLGGRKFFAFYMISGIGAGLIQLLVNWISFESGTGPALAQTIGASGAVFGILIGFGMMHPNSVIMMLIPPIPMKAKWFVIIYAGLELFLGVRGSGGTIAHFAHLGGMLFGFLLLWYWKRKKLIYY